MVLANTRIESGSLYAGVPARKIKDLTSELFKGEVKRIADNYIMYSEWYKEEE